MENQLESLRQLVDNFINNIDEYTSSRYDERNTQNDFINKFFKLLGWDVYNDQALPEDFRDVILEDKVYIEGHSKSPDYVFKYGKQRYFFVEAKKPAVNIKDGTEPAFQLRRYAHSAELNLSILTNFKEFAIYDTRILPNIKDKPGIARIFYCTFEEYEKNWDFINDTFSKKAIMNDSLKKFSIESKAIKGTQPLDKGILEMIEHWRKSLAENIALKNHINKIRSLNEAVQKIIDRVIFLRIAEDRNTEVEGFLKKLADEKNIYYSLVKYFTISNKKYNSGLFAEVDWLNNLNIDDKVLKSIINDLYYPNPYEFAVLPIEILGRIYEQFLGKTITFTRKTKYGHTIDVEEKAEVRKAGGVYYTPQYIVDYIVQNTVGKKIEKQSPKQIEKLTILDPACGSGSFLVGAYKYLLSFHLSYYIDKKRTSQSQKDGKIYLAKKDTYRLTVREKRNILINNIYGVDIDPQAVEVTKLSLLLALMEGEIVEARKELFFKSSNEALLPDLSNNIKCGNSLVGSDFFKDKNLTLFNDEEMEKINCFDWDLQFNEIMKSGGFDCVIGNPPYVDNRGFDKIQLQYFYSKYLSFTKAGTEHFKTRKFNSFVAFIENLHKYMKPNGLSGYIIHKNFLKTTTYIGIRNFVLEHFQINKIVDWGADQFKGVVAETISIFLEKTIIKKSSNIEIEFFQKDKKINVNDVNQVFFNNTFDNIFNINLNNKDVKLLSKIGRDKIKLVELVNINNGIVTGNDKKFVCPDKINNNYKVCITGKDIKRYCIVGKKGYLLYDKDKLMRARNQNIFEMKEKLIMQMINIRLVLAFDNHQFYNLGTTYAITKRNEKINLKFILGILNSKMMNYYYLKKFTNESNLTNAISTKNLFEFPIIDCFNAEVCNNSQYDKMVGLVEQMLEAQKLHHDNPTPTQKQRIEILDKQIDALVYELYGLTKEEIDIMESN